MVTAIGRMRNPKLTSDLAPMVKNKHSKIGEKQVQSTAVRLADGKTQCLTRTFDVERMLVLVMEMD
jgi:hypothetical protein